MAHELNYHEHDQQIREEEPAGFVPRQVFGAHIPCFRRRFCQELCVRNIDTDSVKQIEFQHCDSRPILGVYEGILAIEHAAQIVGFSAADIEKVFWRNAVRGFGIDWPS